MKKITMTTTIGTLSKTYIVHSCASGYPSFPMTYSTIRNAERTRISALTAYNMCNERAQGIPGFADSGVGKRRSRLANTMAVTQKSENETSWMAKPATTSTFPH